MYLFENLQLDLQPVALPYTEEAEQETGNLIANKTQPNAQKAKAQRVAQQPAHARADNRHADERCQSRKLRVTCTAQASKEDNLCDLQIDNKAQNPHDHLTEIQNLRLT